MALPIKPSEMNKKCPQCTVLRKEKRTLIADLNKANDQIASLEDLVFELDKRLEEAKVADESASSTMQDVSSAIPLGIVASVRSRYAKADSSRLQSSNTGHMHSAAQEKTKGEDNPADLEESLPDLPTSKVSEERNSIRQEASFGQEEEGSRTHLRETRKLLSLKELQLAEMAKKLQFAQDEIERLHTLRASSEKSLEQPSKTQSAGSDAAQKAAALQTALIKINLLRRKVAHEKYQAEQEKLLLKHALDVASTENQKAQSALSQLSVEKNHMEEMFFEALAKQKHSQERESQLVDELRVVRTHSLFPYGYPSTAESVARESIPGTDVIKGHTLAMAGTNPEGDSVRNARIMQSKSAEDNHIQKQSVGYKGEGLDRKHPSPRPSATSETASKCLESPSLMKSKRGTFWKRGLTTKK
ncbi:uncharacterized protein LOC129598554 isoform X2 [Paramacrobiotus metropolitanus]|uniref:uncharacterized protein LOC129598554 isoform X2 n=1 Tax=Paramacrobiotus metropolitanus TaxID=2943436 RepID=UPI00244607AF|nr:uncharacterized protein LOC129598554 isoform X2 [Paramacrobiotus metropolitanus]